MRVRLIKDLTKYDSHLTIGAEGYVDLEKISYNDWESEMVLCKFPNADALPIGWNALEIIDKQYWKDRERDIKQAEYIEIGQGPRGGFKWLRIYSKDRSGNSRIFTTNVRHESEKLLKINEKYNKEVKIVIKR